MLLKTISVGLFIILISLWIVTAYFSVKYWIANEHDYLDSDVGYIIILFTALLIVSIPFNLLALFVYCVYFVIDHKVKSEHHQLLVDRKSRTGLNQIPKPLVSIILPVRNEEMVIRKTILNCLKQSYQNIEVIVICSNCNDDSYYECLIDDKRVKAYDLGTSKIGKGAALDYGLKKSNGEFLCIVDADNILEEHFIENAIPLFAEYSILQGRITSLNKNYNFITKILSLEEDLYSAPFMTVKYFLEKRTPLAGTGFMVRKEIVMKEGGFSKSLKDDSELSFRLFKKGYKIAFAPLSITYDETLPYLELIFNQRARWIKGRFELLKQCLPNYKDITGIIFWLTPISMIAAMVLIILSSIIILDDIIHDYIHHPLLYFPITFFIAIQLLETAFHPFIIKKLYGRITVKILGYILLSRLFCQFWYVALIRSFFVKGWGNTKSTHGFRR